MKRKAIGKILSSILLTSALLLAFSTPAQATQDTKTGSSNEDQVNRLEQVESTVSPKILVKDVTRTVKIGDKIDKTYILKGVTATDSKDGDLTEKITYDATFTPAKPAATKSVKKAEKLENVETLDSSVEGEYSLNYKVTNEAGTTTVEEAKIKVAPVATQEPTLTIKEPKRVVGTGDKIDKAYILAGVAAKDSVEGDLTSKVTYSAVFTSVEGIKNSAIENPAELDTIKAGSYTVTYTVANTAGQKATLEAKIDVLEKVVEPKPGLTISKSATVKEVTVGEVLDKEYILSGITATDPVYGDLTSAISYVAAFKEIGVSTKSAETKNAAYLDTSKAGIYYLTYTVTNKDGVQAQLTDEIRVVEKTVPTTDDSLKTKPVGVKPQGRLPDTGEHSNVAMVVSGMLLILSIVYVMKKRMKQF